MSELKFRNLRADEIEVRVQSAKVNGVVLLLYKDARVDQTMLDETVGPMNWQRMHTRDNANCIVSIWDKEKSQWIAKEDTGTESSTVPKIPGMRSVTASIIAVPSLRNRSAMPRSSGRNPSGTYPAA